jgi:Fur family transcriptional regulator, zinc uptake regulator
MPVVESGGGTCLYFCCSAIYMLVIARFNAERVRLKAMKPKQTQVQAKAKKPHLHLAFPTPGHDHDRCASDAIANAEAICAARKERLTPIRRNVLEALLASHAPLGAYELIDRLAVRGARPAPITIYRALDFLREQGLVHRIESRNAFIACVHNHDSHDPVVFLICEKCGAVGEAASAAVAETIKTASRAAGFTPKTPVIEISGICAHCKVA